jgi:AcrR family transcriptional regulator
VAGEVMPVFGEGAQPEDGAVGVGNVECPAQAVLSDGRVRHPELVEPGAPALERCAIGHGQPHRVESPGAGGCVLVGAERDGDRGCATGQEADQAPDGAVLVGEVADDLQSQRPLVPLAAPGEIGHRELDVARIATAAGVAERTLYAAYPTKLALFQAVLDDVTVGGEQPVTAVDVPDFVAAVAARDVTRVATVVADVAARLVDRTGESVVTMLESSGADEDMRQLADWGFRRSREDAGRVCAALEETGLLRPGRDAASVADELHVLCSPQVHHVLRFGHRWSEQRYRRWLEEGVVRLLTEPAAVLAQRTAVTKS